MSAEIQNMALSDEILKPHRSASTESVDIVQQPEVTEKEQVQARENALKYRAMRRLERRERNHRLAEEACQVGDALFEQNDYAGAAACYYDATNLWPSNSEFYLKLAKAYVRRELYVDAAHAATRALSFDPKSLEARFYRGVARLEQGLLPAAKIDFETVIAYDPVHVLAHSSLGRTLSLLQATKIGTHVLYPPPVEVTQDGGPVDFAFPGYEDERLEIVEPSDSSDCNHVGNGVPCRFYNHDGCARGAECDFSHAPDEKSVRDDMGQNVCLYYLLSSCKFGDNKCIYLHDKGALPSAHGWWNDPEQVKRVKEVVEVAERRARERRVKGGRGAQRGDARKSRGKQRGGREKARPAVDAKGKVGAADASEETEAPKAVDAKGKVDAADALKTDAPKEDANVGAESGAGSENGLLAQVVDLGSKEPAVQDVKPEDNVVHATPSN